MKNKNDVVTTKLGPQEIIRSPLLNKGTAFTKEEREELGLVGYLPAHVSTIEQQLQRRYKNYSKKTTDIGKYIYLTTLQDRNEVLFYRLALEHCEEMLPYIYTPTVGDASLDFSNLYSQNRGLYIAYDYQDKMEEMIQNISREHVDVIVVTDGSRILGLGDVGVGGMTIPVGKLSLYSLFGGINPARTLPIVLDVGTDNSALLNDPLYLGSKHPRVKGEEYDAFVEKFVRAIKKRFPNVLLQWEDFSKDHARALLERYQDQICSFNDDIQGTASVTLAALLAALKASKGSFKDQRIVIAGGGAAGIGIANLLVREMLKNGISQKDAERSFYILNSKGLIHDKKDRIDDFQKPYAASYEEVSKWDVAEVDHITLEETVRHTKPTILLGLSAQPKIFTETIIREMAKHTERPIIFPLSNPTSRSEADPNDLIRWTDGKALIATGSPSTIVNHEEKQYCIGQCNNVYIFPGVGLGVIASQSRIVTDEMFLIAAEVLSSKSPVLKGEEGASLFPSVKSLREISCAIAIEVAKHAFEKGYARAEKDDPETLVKNTQWFPEYATIKKAT